MSIILAIILFIVAIGAYLSGMIGLIVSAGWELGRWIVTELSVVVGSAVEIDELPVVAFIVLMGYLIVKHFRE